MKVQITVDANIISALKHFAALDDVRYYLNGIRIELTETDAYFVATDGAILACYRKEVCLPEIAQSPVKSVVVPHDLLKAIKQKGSVIFDIDLPEPAAEGDGQGFESDISVTYEGATYSKKGISPASLSWRQVIPSKVTGEFSQFNLDKLVLVQKAWKCLHGRQPAYVLISHNGTGTALIDMKNENFAAIIVPLNKNAGEPLSAPPAWVFD